MTEYKLSIFGNEAPKKQILKTSTGDVMIIYPETVNRAKQGDEYITSILLSIMETKYYSKLTRNIALPYKSDAVQTCHMAVLESLKTYQPDKGASFETYVLRKLKKSLIDFICETEAACKMTPEALYNAWEDITTDDFIMENMIKSPTAPTVKVKKSPVSTTLQAQLKAIYNCGDYDAGEESAAKDEMESNDIKLSISFKGLKAREIEIIKKHYLEGKTTLELAKEYGISDRRVREIRKVARLKMQNENKSLRKEF